MALNQNAHKRNMQLMNEELQRLKQNQQKYDITPQKAVDYVKTANNLANKAGNGLDKLGQLTNNENISNIGQKIANNTGSNLKNNVFNFAKDKIGSLMSKPTANPSIGNAVSNVAPQATTSLPTAISSAAPTTAGAGTLAGAGSAASGSALTSALTSATSAGTAAGTGAGTAAGTSALTSAIGAAAPSAAATTAGLGAGAGAAGAGAGTTAAAAGMSAIPVAGWIAAAALMAYQLGSSIYKKKKAEAHQKTQKAAAESTQASLEGMNEIKQKIAEKQAQQKQAFADNPINGQLGDGQQVPMAKPSQEPNSSLDILGDTLAEKGNIDLGNRPIVNNQDGSFSTVKSMSFNDGNHEVLIPTISDDGTEWSEQDAIDNYYKTGNHLGKFNSIDDANNYAQALHNQQEKAYEGQFTGGAAQIDADLLRSTGNFATRALENIPENPEHSQKFWDTQKQFLTDLQNKTSIVKPVDISTFTPEQKARYDYAIADQNRVNDMIRDAVHKQTGQTSIRQVTPTEQGLTDNTIPALPNAAPSQTQNVSTNGTLAGQTPQFEVIEPPTGTTTPTEQTTAQPQEVAEQVAQGQPAVQNPTIYKEPKTKQDIIANIFSKAKMGYDENSMNGFNPENVIAKEYEANVQDKDGNIKKENIKKDIWNRVGEAIGTGKRVLSNPLAQGGIAGLIYKATGGDTGESIKYGVDWAQDKAKSDFYQKQIDPNAKPNVFGGRYTAEDWKNKAAIENAKATQQLAAMRAENDEMYKKAKADELKMKILKEQHDMEVQKLSTEGFNEYQRLIADLDDKYKGLPEEKRMQKLEAILQQVLAKYPSSADRIKSHNQVIKSHRDLY